MPKIVGDDCVAGRGLRPKLRFWAATAAAWLLPAVGVVASPPATLAAYAERPLSADLATLRSRLIDLTQGSRERVGLAAIDLATGEMVSVRGDERFPMASTVKVAIAAVFLRDVQAGHFDLDQRFGMSGSQRRMAGRVGNMRAYRGSFTGAQLVERMLIESDNSAADILLDAVGGPRAIGTWLTTVGVAGQRMDRSIAQLLADHEVRKRERVGRRHHKHWITVSVPRAAPTGDVRDSSTPEAMSLLLAKLRGGQLLDAERTRYLFDVMARCRTGSRRIRGLLPAGTPVAHKTGTLNGITDDVGIISLPNGHDLAVAIFEQGRAGPAAHDRSIARISRMLYDGFDANSAGDVARSTGSRAEIQSVN